MQYWYLPISDALALLTQMYTWMSLHGFSYNILGFAGLITFSQILIGLNLWAIGWWLIHKIWD